MKKLSDLPVHSIVGGMTTDYFDFWCAECGSHIDRVEFYSEDSVGLRLRAVCPQCKVESIFKLKVSPPLGPLPQRG